MEEQDSEAVACLSCQDRQSELFFCNVCKFTLCARCWDQQLVHKIGIPHEKTGLDLERRIRRVFTHSIDDTAYERLHTDDQDSIWFDIGYSGFSDDLVLRDYGKYADLICGADSRRPEFRQRRSNLTVQPMVDLKSCHPGLVSLVGETGAGKSTLVKLLVLTTAPPSSDDRFPTPVAGIPGQHIPTSAGIHLYADPQTIASAKPVLYADCEGIDGGTAEPRAAIYRRGRLGSIDSTPLSETSGETPFYVQRRLAWANDDEKRSRGFAVTHLYPRILFAFSDVVVFVHLNPRTIEDVLEKLMKWAAEAETSSNQPVLPYAILVLNQCEDNIDPALWDVDAATRVLLESLAESVDKSPVFKTQAKMWRNRGKQIKSVEDLILCYYSRLRVVRIPTDFRPKLLHEQALKLHGEVQRGISVVQERKARLRLLLNALDFQVFFQHALDHICTAMDKPFDFVQASFSNSRLSSDFSQSILSMAIALKKSSSPPDAAVIFDKLSNLIASCIMLDAIRNHVRGTADRILPKYSARIEAALVEFCDRHWPCEYVQIDPYPQSSGANWDNSVLFTVASQRILRLQCTNVKAAHGTRGHQLDDGRYFASGNYHSRFSVETQKSGILNKIYFVLHHLLDNLSNSSRPGETQLDTASRIHRDEILNPFFNANERGRFTEFQNAKFCSSCLFEAVYHTLPCGHSLCRECIKAYGLWKSKTVVEVLRCPLSAHSRIQQQSRSIYLKPNEAGLRILCLDDGGVNSMVQVEVLKMLEKEFQGRLPLQCFFDMVVGEGTGGVLALGLGSRGWTAQDCEKNLTMLLQQSLVRSRRWLANMSPRQRQSGGWKYHAKRLEEPLKQLFTTDQPLVDQSLDCTTKSNHSVRVAVRTRMIGGYAIIFSNYLSKNTYSDVKFWESARATMAIKPLFKPFVHEKLGPLSLDRARDSVDTVAIAAKEIESAFGDRDQPVLDVVLSLCCCAEQDDATSLVDIAEFTEGTNWRDLLENDRTQSLGVTPTRFQIRLRRPPSFDDLASIDRIQKEVKFQINPMEIRGIAARLFAYLFYVETDNNAHEPSRDGILVQTQILCRLPDGSNEIRQLGELLRTGTFSGLTFVFREEGCQAQGFVIPPETIVTDLIRDHKFSAPKFPVHLTARSAVVHATIYLRNGKEFSLSGFPKQLIKESNSSAPLGAGPGSDSGNSISGRLPVWKAPSLKDLPSPSELSLSPLDRELEDQWPVAELAATRITI
ncbi:hypothetical protein K432DRAFT_425035 [Lepidopterella palustris CBS 459.81]|uniref:FabD/lysophospholipase-like protein n=1 Tax=Lepidopterella palustris CBS 459.81 TaxID=1314670 RepID=A0A8E2EC54_9PEZI|nr:hypothetical protein K432DRAFT_425035 [Lepidopterella palustris CBS 459.81]